MNLIALQALHVAKVNLHDVFVATKFQIDLSSFYLNSLIAEVYCTTLERLQGHGVFFEES